jgi:IS605 OrfB family transposase
LRNTGYSLRVRLPNAAPEKHLLIAGVRFAYGQEQLEESLACGRALSYRFLRDKKGWRVFVSIEVSPVERITDKRWGAIGIDINPDQLVLAELDRFGNFTGGQHLSCVTYGKTREQAKAILGDAVKQAIAVAIQSHKPMVLERLEFSKKKAALENEGRGRARMLYQVIQYLKAAAFRAGVQIIQVNPAYTSTIGAVNYAARFGISIRTPASLCIQMPCAT